MTDFILSHLTPARVLIFFLSVSVIFAINQMLDDLVPELRDRLVLTVLILVLSSLPRWMS